MGQSVLYAQWPTRINVGLHGWSLFLHSSTDSVEDPLFLFLGWQPTGAAAAEKDVAVAGHPVVYGVADPAGHEVDDACKSSPAPPQIRKDAQDGF